jgi:hypothetical protein
MIDAAPGAHLPPEPGVATRIFLVDTPTPDVSSTTIRGRCAEGASIAGLVPESVVRHIHRHGLYRGRVSGSDVAAAPGAAASQLHEQESH